MIRGVSVILFLCLYMTTLSCSFPVLDEECWTVMTWNVQNLFDGVDDGTEYAEFDPSGPDWDGRLYERRLERTGEVVKDCVSGGPDLVVLQELEKPEILEALIEGPLRHSGYGYHVAISGYGIIRCGLMSRYPLVDIWVVDCGTWWNRSLRPVVAATVLAPGGPVRVIACHWKSPRNGRAATEGARRREAEAARALALEAGASRDGIPVIIIGDLNTQGDGVVVPAALAPWEPHRSDSEPGAVLYRTPFGVGAGIHGGELVFFDPEPSSGPPGTYWYQGKWDRPDHALLSEAFVDGAGLEFLSCRTAAVSTMGDSQGHPKRWISDFEEGYSDHFPLVLEFSTVGEKP